MIHVYIYSMVPARCVLDVFGFCHWLYGYAHFNALYRPLTLCPLPCLMFVELSQLHWWTMFVRTLAMPEWCKGFLLPIGGGVGVQVRKLDVVPLLAAIAGCHCWAAIAGDGGGGCTRWRIGRGVIAGHCWLPLLGCHCWVPLLGIGVGVQVGGLDVVTLLAAVAGCHCWAPLLGCHCCYVLVMMLGGSF